MLANTPQVAETREQTRKQRVRVRGEELLAKVRELIHEGNARRIIVIGDDGTTLLEIPLTAGIVGTVMAPALVAVGAIAALATNYTLLIDARNPLTPATSGDPLATAARQVRGLTCRPPGRTLSAASPEISAVFGMPGDRQ